MKLVLYIILFLAGGRVFGQFWNFDYNFGEASFQFLKINLSPRIVSLAGAGSALNGSGLAAADVNPAAASSDTGALYLSYALFSREDKAKAPHITWNIPVDEYRLFLNAKYLGYKDIPGWDDYNNPTTSYGAHTMKFQTGLAGNYKSLCWGFSLNYAMNSISYANYSSVLFNAGLQYQLIQNLWAGAALTNAGIWTSSALIPGNKAPVPPTIARAGLAYLLKLGKGFSILTAVDARTRNDERLHFPAGLEIGWKDIIYLRTGYPFLEPEPSMPFGVGLRWNRFILDYAVHRHATLSSRQFFALGIRF